MAYCADFVRTEMGEDKSDAMKSMIPYQWTPKERGYHWSSDTTIATTNLQFPFFLRF